MAGDPRPIPLSLWVLAFFVLQFAFSRLPPARPRPPNNSETSSAPEAPPKTTSATQTTTTTTTTTFTLGDLPTKCSSEAENRTQLNSTALSSLQLEKRQSEKRRSQLFWDGPRCSVNEWDKPQYCKCKKGERISRFESYHDDRKEDRQWYLGCSAIRGGPGDEVRSVTDTNDWDAPQEWNGIYSNSFLVGFTSYHDNRREDRRYTFFTARANSFYLTKCSRWQKLNRFDKPIYLWLKDNEVIAAVKSVHNDRHEDREFSVITCRLTYLEPELRTHGFAFSPNYPRNYPDNYENSQTISVEEGNILILHFTAFNIESHSHCWYDYMEIIDGDGSQLMWRCGDVRPSTIISRSNRVTLRFRTDGSQTRTGWRLQWYAKPGCSELGKKRVSRGGEECVAAILAAIATCAATEALPGVAILGCAAAVITVHAECKGPFSALPRPNHNSPCNNYPSLPGCYPHSA